MKLFIGALGLCFSVSSVANPATEQMTYWKLSALYAKTVEMYDNMMEQLKTAQAANDELVKMKNLSQDLVKEYEFVEGFSVDAEIAKIKNDVDSLTMLDDMGEMSTLDKIKTVNVEIDRRFRHLTPEERQRRKDRMARIITLSDLEKAKKREAIAASNGEMTTKSLLASNASSNALLVALTATEEQRKVMEDESKREGMSEVFGTTENMKDYFERQSKGGN